MRFVMIFVLVVEFGLFCIDVSRSQWLGAFGWMAGLCCVGWYFASLDREPERRKTSDHRRQ